MDLRIFFFFRTLARQHLTRTFVHTRVHVGALKLKGTGLKIVTASVEIPKAPTFREKKELSLSCNSDKDNVNYLPKKAIAQRNLQFFGWLRVS